MGESKFFTIGLILTTVIALAVIGIGARLGNLSAFYRADVYGAVALAAATGTWLMFTGSRRAAFLCLAALAACGAVSYARCYCLGVTSRDFGTGCLAYVAMTLIYLCLNLDEISKAARQRFEADLDAAISAEDDQLIKSSDDSLPFMRCVCLIIVQMLVVMFLGALIG